MVAEVCVPVLLGTFQLILEFNSRIRRAFDVLLKLHLSLLKLAYFDDVVFVSYSLVMELHVVVSRLKFSEFDFNFPELGDNVSDLVVEINNASFSAIHTLSVFLSKGLLLHGEVGNKLGSILPGFILLDGLSLEFAVLTLGLADIFAEGLIVFDVLFSVGGNHLSDLRVALNSGLSYGRHNFVVVLDGDYTLVSSLLASSAGLELFGAVIDGKVQESYGLCVSSFA